MSFQEQILKITWQIDVIFEDHLFLINTTHWKFIPPPQGTWNRALFTLDSL